MKLGTVAILLGLVVTIKASDVPPNTINDGASAQGPLAASTSLPITNQQDSTTTHPDDPEARLDSGGKKKSKLAKWMKSLGFTNPESKECRPPKETGHGNGNPNVHLGLFRVTKEPEPSFKSHRATERVKLAVEREYSKLYALKREYFVLVTKKNILKHELAKSSKNGNTAQKSVARKGPLRLDSVEVLTVTDKSAPDADNIEEYWLMVGTTLTAIDIEIDRVAKKIADVFFHIRQLKEKHCDIYIKVLPEILERLPQSSYPPVIESLKIERERLEEQITKARAKLYESEKALSDSKLNHLKFQGCQYDGHTRQVHRSKDKEPEKKPLRTECELERNVKDARRDLSYNMVHQKMLNAFIKYAHKQILLPTPKLK
ncbi:hypothetical protein BASA60_009900 [Batrachochytrium salamandrivorans]|nr:hypothetical protein BASA60_009900 [Batrachochytrium salamandrivorans]KAH9250706.1 hypothetical protein BASA81_011489 [Batrachochytrium salamandrivorans]